MLIGVVTSMAARVGISLAPLWAGAILMGLAVAGFGLFTKTIYDKGYASADEMWTARALQSKIDAAEKDRDVANKAAADAALKLATIEAETKADNERTGQYVAELERKSAANAATGKPDACLLDDTDLRGLSAQPADSRPARTGIAAKALNVIRARRSSGAQSP
jgi:hypothetical protein